MSPRDYQRLIEQLTDAMESRSQLGDQMAAYDVVFRRDPMRPLIDAAGGVTSAVGLHDGLSVQGIIWSEKRPLAVIEGDIYSIGEVVGPYTILEIKPNGLVAQRANEMLFIPLDRGVGTARVAPISTAPTPPAPVATAAATVSPAATPISAPAETPALAPPTEAPAPVSASTAVLGPTALGPQPAPTAPAPSGPPTLTLPMKLDARPIPDPDASSDAP